MLEFTAIALFVVGVTIFVLGFTLIGKGNLASAGTVAKNSGILVLALSPLIVIIDGFIGLQAFASSLINDLIVSLTTGSVTIAGLNASQVAALLPTLAYLTGLDPATLGATLGVLAANPAALAGALNGIPQTSIATAATNIANSVMYIPLSVGILAGLLGGILVTIGITLEKGTMDFPPISNFAIFGAVYTTIAGVWLLIKATTPAPELKLLTTLSTIPGYSGLAMIPLAVLLVGVFYLLLTILLALIAMTGYGKLQFKPMGIALIVYALIFLIIGTLVLAALTPAYTTPLVPK